MKNYQRLHYKHYYRMRPNGDAVECTRQECFAPAKTPTADNPFIQRWYYSPDREMAMRLSRNTKGDETYKANAADLKKQEREQGKTSLCIAQTSAATCPVTCETCPNRKYCESPHRATNGTGCKCKCDCCSVYMRRTLDLDRPLGFNDDGTEVMFELEDQSFVETTCIADEQHLAILVAIGSLTPEERYLWDELLSEKTKAKIAEECDLSEGAIRKRVKKLARTLRENPALKNYFE